MTRKAAFPGIAAATLFAAAASAGPDVLSAPLCGVLKGVAPKTRGLEPEAARAQLVRALIGAFDRDTAKLKQVRERIDDATLTKCPKEREVVLGITKAKTLAEAIE